MLLRRSHFDRSPSSPIRTPLHHGKLRKQLQEYQGFVASVGTQIGELSPISGEDLRDIRVLVRMAARTMGLSARTWVDDGKVYFYVRHNDHGIGE